MADLIRNGVTNQQMSTNASLFGANLFQSADETVAYVMGPGGPQQFLAFSQDPADGFFYEQREAFKAIVEAEYGTVYERAFAEVQTRAIETADTVSAALTTQRQDNPLTTTFPASQLGTQLETVAYLIAARNEVTNAAPGVFRGCGWLRHA